MPSVIELALPEFIIKIKLELEKSNQKPYYMKYLILTALISLIFFKSNAQKIDSLSVALDIINLSFKASQRDSMKTAVLEEAKNYKGMRNASLPNDLPYSLVLMPPLNTKRLSDKQETINWNLDAQVELPNNIEDLAFFPVYKLSALIKSKKISSVELTKLFLTRLKKYGSTLESVITITDSWH
jgi:hypothetical protein